MQRLLTSFIFLLFSISPTFAGPGHTMARVRLQQAQKSLFRR